MKCMVLVNKIYVMVVVLGLLGCDGQGAKTTESGNDKYLYKMADSIHTVLESDRTVYAKHVVTRLVNKEKKIKASEYWKEDAALPLPAQMFRLSSEESKKSGSDLSYSLISMWPVNSRNKPATQAEKNGLKHIVSNPGENYYEKEKLGDDWYFTAVYPDIAVSDACVSCHNNHKDSPRNDFELGKVMGAVVVRITL